MTSDSPTHSTIDEQFSKQDISIEDFQHPGILFAVADHEFLTIGSRTSDGIAVTRVETGERETINKELLSDDIEAGDVELLGTHATHTEISVDRLTLTVLVDFAADELRKFPADIPNGVEQAVVDGQELLADSKNE